MDPLTVPDESIAALERVAAEAQSYLAELTDAPVRSASSDEAAERFGGRLPDEGVGTIAAIEELLRDGIEAHVRSGGPRFFHWVIGGPTPAAPAAGWGTSLLDPNAGRWDATQHGVDVSETGLAALPQARVLSSRFIHVSALKALAMLGVGRGQVIDCSGPDGSFDLERLEETLGDEPTIVIANAGEVNAGHFDPIREVAQIAHRRNAWVHVDGAFGLFARLSSRVAGLADGVELADSVISDGHKWLNVPYDCGLAFVRDPAYLRAPFSAGAAYLPEDKGERPVFGFMGPELSRRARSLAVWATLRAYGRDGYRAIVERCLDNAAHVARLVEEADDLELLLPAPLNIVFFRYRPPGVRDEELDELNLRIGREVLTDGRVYVGTTRWRGAVGFRPAFVNWRTTRADAELVLETVRDLGSRLLASQ